MIELRSLHHLSFTVPHLQASLGFWRDLLGFEPIARPDLGFPGAWLRRHGVEVRLLAPVDGVSAEARLSPVRNHVAFRVENLDGVRRKLEAAGLEVLGGRGTIRQLFVLDPGANEIEFIEPT